MDYPSPITRRDAVAAFLYIFIVASTIFNLIQVLGYRIALHFLGPPNTAFGRGVVDFIAFVLLLFWPLVPLIASGVAGRYAERAVTKQDVRTLVLCCAGLVICALSLPTLLTTSYYWYDFSDKAGSTNFAHIYKAYAISYFATFSLGFALAFFPTILDTIRARANAEEGSSTF